MSIALFDEPPRVTIRNPSAVGGSRNGLLIGLLNNDGQPFGVVCLEDGDLSVVHVSDFSIDYRYDVKNDRWVDKNNQEPDQEG